MPKTLEEIKDIIKNTWPHASSLDNLMFYIEQAHAAGRASAVAEIREKMPEEWSTVFNRDSDSANRTWGFNKCREWVLDLLKGMEK